MIKFMASTSTGRKLLGLVITDGNIEELKKGNPIFFNAEEMGLPAFKFNDLTIAYYPTEEDAKADFEAKGFITPLTIVRSESTKH